MKYLLTSLSLSALLVFGLTQIAFAQYSTLSLEEESVNELYSNLVLLLQEEKFEKADSFSFTENELKEIVTNSVQNALEKSIAASLVELAVSELKTQVIRMDQSRAL